MDNDPIKYNDNLITEIINRYKLYKANKEKFKHLETKLLSYKEPLYINDIRQITDCSHMFDNVSYLKEIPKWKDLK